VTRPQAGCVGCQSETAAPQKLQVGLLTGTGEICQTIVRLVPSSTYLIEWRHAGRADAASSTVGCATCDGPTPYDVVRGGILLEDYTAEQIGEETYFEAGGKFFATATSHDLCFNGTGASDDEATFIDHVVVLQLDEIFSDGFECTFGLWSAVTGAS
jgi:hypothetical protein